MSIKIAASVVCCDLMHLKREIDDLQGAGCDILHVDVMDGCFVDGSAMSAYDVRLIKNMAKVPIDVHMMVEEPIWYVEVFKDAGADMMMVHYEACENIVETLIKIKQCGLKAGVAIYPETSHLLLEPLLSYVDMVLLMTGTPGFTGQRSISFTVKKTRRLKQMLKDYGHDDIEIQIEGNVNTVTIPHLYSAGARNFVVGNSGLFFGSANYVKNIDELRGCIKA